MGGEKFQTKKKEDDKMCVLMDVSAVNVFCCKGI